MKHVAWAFSGFQTHSDRYRFGTKTAWGVRGLGGRAGRRRIRSQRVRDRSGKDFSNSCWWGRV